MAFVFDIIIVIILAVCIITCRKHGLVRSVIETTGGMIAAFFAYLFAKPAGQWLSETFLKNIFSENVARSLLSIEGSQTTDNASEAILSTDISTVIKDAPQALQDLLKAFNVELIQIQSISDAKTTVAERAEAVIDAIVTPISECTAMVICFLVFYAILMVVVSLLAKFASTVSYIPVVGRLNRFLGTLFGALKGVVLVLVFTAMVNLLIPFIAEPLALDPDDPYANTLICEPVCEINPIITILPEPY